MEIRLTPSLQERLDDLAAQTGRTAGQVIEDALITYIDEFAQVRNMLDRRCDDLESGRVDAVDGEEAYRRLMARNEALRRRTA